MRVAPGWKRLEAVAARFRNQGEPNGTKWAVWGTEWPISSTTVPVGGSVVPGVVPTVPEGGLERLKDFPPLGLAAA